MRLHIPSRVNRVYAWSRSLSLSWAISDMQSLLSSSCLCHTAYAEDINVLSHMYGTGMSSDFIRVFSAPYCLRAHLWSFIPYTSLGVTKSGSSYIGYHLPSHLAASHWTSLTSIVTPDPRRNASCKVGPIEPP